MLSQKRDCLLVCLWVGLVGLTTGCVAGHQQPSLSPTPLLITIPTVTTTISPTVSLQPIESSTPTAVATLSPDEGHARVLDLLANNSGCHLPCWWGITPGQTSWESAKLFFLQFDPEIWSNPPFAEVEIPSEDGFYGDLNQIRVRFILQGNQITAMRVSGLKDSPYLLGKLLNVYGKPEEIWIQTFSQDVGTNVAFTIVLFYPKNGFAAVYSEWTEIEFGSSIIRGCLGKDPGLFLWNPGEKITLKEFGEMFEWDITDYEPYLSLDEATGMDIETFYQTYKDAQGLVCLETPRELWPNPFAP